MFFIKVGLDGKSQRHFASDAANQLRDDGVRGFCWLGSRKPKLFWD
jgi:hypothetical protein